ncbi:sensor domain-containing protein [Streptomyces sp. NPDC045431]|uniref:sensor histidine kinase n=1 Tax=Streptomyces sp. NPDC045431 TaxID=3155613 RepID=UPI0033DFA4A5
MSKARIRGTLLAGVQGLGVALVALAGGITLLSLAVLSIVLIPVGVGVLTTPAVLSLVRAHANSRRRLAAQWAQVTIPVPYRPFPDDVRSGVAGRLDRCGLMLKDPATWRDLGWLLMDLTVGFVTAFLPPALLVYGVHGLLLPAGLWMPLSDGEGRNWYTFVPVTGWGTAFLAALVGAGLLALCSRVGRPLLCFHFVLSRALLGPPREVELIQRIDRLTETRHEALDASAAELRRIERDLHDGAQARLVAMGMSFGTIEMLMDKDPQQAKALLAEARKSSAEALSELRDLVRGIHPPVLAERGLPDAVRALALRMPMTVEIDIDLPGRAEDPIESAVYFAVSEILTNAAKHSGANHLWITIHHSDGLLRASVTDNGRGGAVAGAGSGLSGIEQRVGAFDGVVAVSSPAGGPTTVTLEIPCPLAAQTHTG